MPITPSKGPVQAPLDAPLTLPSAAPQPLSMRLRQALRPQRPSGVGAHRTPKVKPRITYLERPGDHLDDAALARLVAEMRRVASRCFAEVPEYQCLRGRREDLRDKVITLAHDAEGQLLGFCSGVLLDVPGVGRVLHLGLTCVDPNGRGGGLTHVLNSRLVTRYFLRHHLFSRLWVTSVACVLSSLGNMALSFEGVVPSPYAAAPPSDAHRAIARAIDTQHRDKVYILPTASLDEERFVFCGSVRGTVFQKEARDPRFRHRNEFLNSYYESLLDFERGDEAVQVGFVRFATVFRYFQKQGKRGRPSAHAPRVALPAHQPEAYPS